MKKMYNVSEVDPIPIFC